MFLKCWFFSALTFVHKKVLKVMLYGTTSSSTQLLENPYSVTGCREWILFFRTRNKLPPQDSAKIRSCSPCYTVSKSFSWVTSPLFDFLTKVMKNSKPGLQKLKSGSFAVNRISIHCGLKSIGCKPTSSIFMHTHKQIPWDRRFLIFYQL